jgi:hypothetical protein
VHDFAHGGSPLLLPSPITHLLEKPGILLGKKRILERLRGVVQVVAFHGCSPSLGLGSTQSLSGNSASSPRAQGVA